MGLSSNESHLGVTLSPINNNESHDLYEVRNIKISNLSVTSLSLLVEDEHESKQLAYEMEYQNMPEVLAGLRHRFGPPIGTRVNTESGSFQQQWVWHTREDPITAMKTDKNPFLLSYKPLC
tara:strand:- start:82 stop:444 length:363 start_codon:yes stop_codon:yes gene_type:complete